MLERAGRPDPAERPDAGELAVGCWRRREHLERPEPLPLAGATASGRRQSPSSIAIPTQLPPAHARQLRPERRIRRRDPARSRRPANRRAAWQAATAALAVALLVVLAVLARDGRAFAWVKLRVPTHKVPTLVGLTEQQAREQADANHWKVRKLDGREDGSTPGNVIDQDPDAGQSLAEDKTVTITVSLGNTLVTVPTDLVGKTVEDATAQSQATSLDLGTQTPQHDETAPAGTIVLVDPATPAQLPKGEKVNVTVSDGPAPRTVPQLSPAMTFEQASQALAAAGLVGVQSDELNRFSDAVPAGQIIGTDPPAGTEVPRDSKVKVIFSKGPQPIPIPDVRGKSVAEATSTLQAAGLPRRRRHGQPEQSGAVHRPTAGRGTSRRARASRSSRAGSRSP